MISNLFTKKMNIRWYTRPLQNILKLKLVNNNQDRCYKKKASFFGLWVNQIQYILAQRLRRGYQFTIFYQRLLGDAIFLDLLQSFQTQFRRRFNRILFSSVGALAFDWRVQRIKSEDLKSYSNEIAYAKKLLADTVYCRACGKKKRISEKVEGIEYCICNNPQVENDEWVPYIEKEGLTIWRREEKSALYAYKVYAKYSDITANDFLHVQTDLEYRKEWDDSVAKLEIIDADPTDCGKSQIIYWEMQWPKLFANRDYVYNRRYYVDKTNNIIIICNKSTSHPKCPINPKKQRVEEYWSYMVIKPFKSFNEPGLEYVLTYFDNPGLAIPSTITSWVAQKQLPEFLSKLYLATKKYAQHKKSHIKKIATWETFQRDLAQ
ncbi:stAR-related lipid transfer protein 7, mitochondrial [Condylostylus longicornis]|uniref:stAR-related lipid transfer protein 7, mitochondrial n=1 Tax=Condylostylus longicornis TaxID=2530218 RepID=UPI00244E53B7|nr:stAR-related lipid transfer protein 7, mitochondrial [Condylostylus longicornis]